MGFSRSIKEKALVASARHCCVCHRYKGLKIEIHHIKHHSKGGSDTYDNAIPLCFDCHSDIGHYNKEHPKGTKFTEKELKLSREKWYEIVKNHNIHMPEDYTDHLNVRHLVLKDYDTAKEIFSGNLSRIPFNNPLIIENEIYEYIRYLINLKSIDYQVKSIEYKYYNTKKEIFNKYPNLEVYEKSNQDFAYFYGSRIPTKKELMEIKDKIDGITLFMLSNGIKPSEFSKSMISETHDGCAEISGYFKENIIFRSLWFSFIAITNTSKDQITFDSINGKIYNNPSILSDFFDKTDEYKYKHNFPKASILPNETVLIPTAIISCPFENEKFENLLVSTTYPFQYERIQELYHTTRSNIPENCFKILGKYIRLFDLNYYIQDIEFHSSIHPFDLTNLYTIERHWQCGSCPHLFFVKNNGSYEFSRELLNNNFNQEKDEIINVLSDIKKIIISELEDEITFINYITLNNNTIYKNVILHKGDSIEINVKLDDEIVVNGFYKNEFENIRKSEKIIFKNAIICQYLRQKNVPAGFF